MADEDYLPVTSGDTLTVQLEFDEPVDPELPDGARQATNLTGWTFTSQWRPEESHSRAISFAVDASNAATGIIVLSMTGAQTATMLTDGVYDVQGVNGSQVQTFWKEPTKLTLHVTRA